MSTHNCPHILCWSKYLYAKKHPTEFYREQARYEIKQQATGEEAEVERFEVRSISTLRTKLSRNLKRWKKAEAQQLEELEQEMA
jgi:hypothetical protein